MSNVLIIDDEKNVREGLSHFISTLEGFSVCAAAADGAEALSFCVRYRPDIILTDINMPHMDGLTFIARLKSRLPEAEIIVLSGYDYFSYAQRALRLGVRDYLLKPVDRKELAELLRRISDGIGESVRSESPPSNDPAGLCLEIIKRRYVDPTLSISSCAREMFVSPGYLRTLFKRRTGVTFVQYLTGYRMEKARELLLNTDMYVQDVAAAVPFEDVRYFSSLFRQHTGCSPSEYRSKNF